MLSIPTSPRYHAGSALPAAIVADRIRIPVVDNYTAGQLCRVCIHYRIFSPRASEEHFASYIGSIR